MIRSIADRTGITGNCPAHRSVLSDIGELKVTARSQTS